MSAFSRASVARCIPLKQGDRRCSRSMGEIRNHQRYTSETGVANGCRLTPEPECMADTHCLYAKIPVTIRLRSAVHVRYRC